MAELYGAKDPAQRGRVAASDGKQCACSRRPQAPHPAPTSSGGRRMLPPPPGAKHSSSVVMGGNSIPQAYIALGSSGDRRTSH